MGTAPTNTTTIIKAINERTILDACAEICCIFLLLENYNASVNCSNCRTKEVFIIIVLILRVFLVGTKFPEFKVKLQHTSFKDTSVTSLVRFFPFSIDYSEGNVFVGRSSMETNGAEFVTL